MCMLPYITTASCWLFWRCISEENAVQSDWIWLQILDWGCSKQEVPPSLDLYCCDQVSTSCYYQCAVTWFNSRSGYWAVKEEYAEHYELYLTSRLLRNMSVHPSSQAGDMRINCFSCIFQRHSISCVQFVGVLSARRIVVPLSRGTVRNSTSVRWHVLSSHWVHGSLCNC
jgi:hypothetical protein